MAAREANVKLTLDAGSFVSSFSSHMSQVDARARQSERSLKNAFSRGLGGAMKDSFKSGAGGMKSALSDMGTSIKNGVGTVATLGGGLGFGMLLEQAFDMRTKFRNLEFAINKTGNATANWEDLMKDAHAAAQATGHSGDQMADTMAAVFADTGDADFARESIGIIGMTARATGKDLDQLRGVAGMLYEKFGATPATLPAMLAAVAEKTDSGGLSIDAMREKFGLLAGEAVDAGFGGAAGISSIVGMLNVLDDRLGEKSIPSFKKLFQVLKDGSSSLKEIQKGTGLKFKPGATGLEKLSQIVGNDKARAKLEEKLGGEQRVVFDELTKPFKAAFAEAKAQGASTKEATAAGQAAFDEAMAAMSKSTLTAADIVKRAKDQQKEDPRVGIRKAVDRIAMEFQKPQMIEAIDKLADKLPELARGTSNALDWIVRNPKSAVAGVVAGKVALSGIGGFAGKLGEKALSGAFEAASGSFMKGVVAAGGWKTVAGQFGVVAAAAMLAYKAGTAAIDASMDADTKKTDSLADSKTTAEAFVKHGTGTAEQRKAAAEELRQKIKGMEKDGGPGVANKLFGSMANFFDPTVEHPQNVWSKQLEEAKAALAELEKAPQGVVRANERVASAADRAAASLERLGGAASGESGPPGEPTGTSKGPPAAANRRNIPGHKG